MGLVPLRSRSKSQTLHAVKKRETRSYRRAHFHQPNSTRSLLLMLFFLIYPPHSFINSNMPSL
ncbi:Uncharacterized protein APZ42_019595 [Daphnia magna]|uniref:Uncharacterized protein n=1 Tax=Daphnia magna TaxID=35525 RepID=A0A164Y9H2_9CRUS|nr:Uncharacterized protein APZ42_019595 [Daphnia magna]